MINESFPYVFEPNHNEWRGDDGPWSTFVVNVGTPPQEFYVLPATNVQETWVPLPQACSDYVDECPSLRGVPSASGFDTNRSTTWSKEGIYDLVSEQNLGNFENGLYGFDTVQLGNSTQPGPRLENQVVAGLVGSDFWLGIFGLGPKPANFSNLNDPQPSFMRTLVDQKLIPSLSYGYTAGAAYTRTFGSLTLGGYDSSRFVPNDVSFSFAPDDSRSLTVGLQSISATNTLDGDVSPLTSGILALIDSTVPQIWLPPSACKIFERAFGIVYDNTTDLYLVNSSTHATLLRLNPTVTFKLGNDISGGPAVSISLPYGAFDLQARYPYYNIEDLTASTNYFPLRRAANDTQYTLGRAFLQEAYIVADYERHNFSVSQAILSSPLPSRHIVPIRAPNAASAPSSNGPTHISGHKLSTGIIVAISILSTVFLIVTGLVAFGLYRRYRRSRSVDEPDRSTGSKSCFRARRRSKTKRWVSELDAASLSDKKHEARRDMSELPADKEAREYYKPWTWARRQELPGSVTAQELEGQLKATGPTVTSHERTAPWEKDMVELPGHEARSKRSSAKSGQSRSNLKILISQS